MLIDLAFPYAASVRPRAGGRFRHAVTVASVPVQVEEFSSRTCPVVAIVGTLWDERKTTYRSVGGLLATRFPIPSGGGAAADWIARVAANPRRDFDSPWPSSLFMQEFGRPVGSRAAVPGLAVGEWVDEEDPRFEFNPPGERYSRFRRETVAAESSVLRLVDGEPWVVAETPVLRVFGNLVQVASYPACGQPPGGAFGVFSLAQREAAIRFACLDESGEDNECPTVELLEPSLIPTRDYQVEAMKQAGLLLAECGSDLFESAQAAKASRLLALSREETPDGDALAEALEDVTAFVTVKRFAFPAYDALRAYRLSREVEAANEDDEQADLSCLRP